MKTTLLVLALLCSTLSFSQNRLAYIGLTKQRTNIEFIYKDAVTPKCFFNEDADYDEQFAFQKIKQRTDSMLTELGFNIIPEDSVVNSDAYRAISEEVEKMYKHAENRETQAKGYGQIHLMGLGAIQNIGNYFTIPSNPDVVANVIYSYTYKLNIINGVKTLSVECYVYLGVFTKKKKVFSISATHRALEHISIVRNDKSCWGFDINQNTNAVKYRALGSALDKLKKKMDGAQKSVEKYNAKLAK